MGLTYKDAGRRHRGGRRAGRAHQAARRAHPPPGGGLGRGRLRRPLRPAAGEVPRAGAGLRHRRRRHEAQARHRRGEARHGGHRPGGDERQRRPHLRRRAALLPRLPRHRPARRGPGRAGGGRHRRGLRAGRAAPCSAARPPSTPASHGNEYDLAGFCVGVVERARILTGRSHPAGGRAAGPGEQRGPLQRLQPGRGASSRTRGWRSTHGRPSSGARPLAEVLLEPTRIYVKDVLALLDAVEVRGLAHVTGSGLPGNVPRCLPDGTRAVLEARRWPRPAVFDWLQRLGGRVATPRWTPPSTWAWEWWRWCLRPRCPRRSRCSPRGAVPAWEVGRVEASSGEPTAVVVR